MKKAKAIHMFKTHGMLHVSQTDEKEIRNIITAFEKREIIVFGLLIQMQQSFMAVLQSKCMHTHTHPLKNPEDKIRASLTKST